MSLLVVAFTVLLERKLLGRVQLRTRPYNVGFIGLLQTVVDGIKLLTKRSIGRKLYTTSRYFLICRVVINTFIGVSILMVMLIFISYVFLLGVIYSENIYSILGRLRRVMSMISYDILLLVLIVIPLNVTILAIILVFSAEVRRTPVDLVEGESELVSGFNTEFAGGVFVRYFLREYLSLTIFFFVFFQDRKSVV